ncbi:MAG: PKD domain-containing protein, partial [Halobacteriales archaeon]|nr:PKD domain-containing protein [Halobacteriales archaeon]
MRRVVAPGLALLLLAGALAGCTAPAKPVSQDPLPSEPVQPTAQPGGPDLPPTAAFDWFPQQPATGEEVRFLDRSNDPDDGVAGRVWLFGDGTTSRLANASHVYLAPGTFTVALLVSDRAGLTANASHTITVLPGNTTTVRYGPRPHAVIALIDTGINPYHKAYSLPAAQASPATFLDGYPLDARPLNLTLGIPYADAVKADDAAWKGVQTKQL